MSHSLRLVLVFHNHQPIGNFDHVFEQAYQDSYLPFLDVFQDYPDLKIALHTSGSLMEWLDAKHPEYVDRLAGLVAAGCLEIVGGAYYEPILTMIPSRDRIGQITTYSEWLTERLGAEVRGMWTPERVWEQSLASDLVEAGIRYTLLDDFHFKNAGLTENELHGFYVTEDDARMLAVLPGSERLRYLIPFAAPHETIDYLRGVAEQSPGAVMVFGDDGEKFGSWPDTYAHVYERGWLRQFFDALRENSEWLRVTTPSEALESVPPLGKIYIPEGSYREMTEWALPAQRLEDFEDLHHRLEEEGRWQEIAPLVKGGYWRNFKVKYPETNEMYARMQMVSRRLNKIVVDGGHGELIEQARDELYRGQCNCGYWHGAFGGAYLPHLRNAVFQHLIAADNLLDQYEGRGLAEGDTPWVDLAASDFNLDGRQELRLANNRMIALVAPSSGGHLYELDVRTICHNLLATLTRHPEAYHRKVLAGPSADGADVASIHDRVVFKQEGLDERLQYDSYPRKSLVDHFFDLDVAFDDVQNGTFQEWGDFVAGAFESKLRRNPDRMQMQLVREGNVGGHPVRLTKGLTLEANSATLEIAYLLENLPTDGPLHFGVELNFAGLPSGADDRYFRSASGDSLGQLGERLDRIDETSLGLVDGWLGIDVELDIDRPTSFWTFPIETVSQSEGGFELVHQSVVVIPHWIVQPDAAGRWSATMRMTLDTSLAEERSREAEETATDGAAAGGADAMVTAS
jgi:alpha-amylase